MNNACLKALESAIRANSINVHHEPELLARRLNYEREVVDELRVLGYLLLMATEVSCILPHQYHHASKLLSESLKLSKAWLKSDRKRSI